MKFPVRLAIVCLAVLSVCAAFPHAAPSDKIQAGTYRGVLGKGPIPSIVILNVTPVASPDWRVIGTYSGRRISLNITGTVDGMTGILTGRGIPRAGSTGPEVAVDGKFGPKTEVKVRLGQPVNQTLHCRFIPAK